MSNTPYFSVIVPAYQAERTLRRCLESIVNQSFNDFEVIIINDGSTDQTYDICKEYECEKVRVISQPNKGISATRQLGLNQAKGKYIQFIDSDDWVDTSYFKNVYELLAADDLDVLILDFWVEKINKTEYKSLGISCCEKEELVKGLVTNIPGVLWNKIIRRELFAKYDINFKSGLSYCEDWVVTYHLFNSPTKIHYCKKAFYHYDMYSNVNSLARSINESTLKNRRDYLTYIKRMGLDKAYPKVYNTQCAGFAYIAVRSDLYTSKQYKAEFSGLDFMDTYLPSYKKMILRIASIFGLYAASRFDGLVRRVMK